MRGTCAVCGREVTLTKGGLLRAHGSKEPGVWPPINCAGSGKEPADPQADAQAAAAEASEAAEREAEAVVALLARWEVGAWVAFEVSTGEPQVVVGRPAELRRLLETGGLA